MWPVLPAPHDRVYGHPSDPLAEVWRLAQFRNGEVDLVGDTSSQMANAPSGVQLRRPIEVSQAVYDALAWTLARILEPVLAYNLLIFLGLTTTGLATYAAVRALGGRPLGAATAAVLLIVAPVHMVEAQLHAALTFVAALPVLLLLGIWTLERPSARRGAAFGAALAACGYFTPYLLLEAAVIGLAVAAAAVVLACRAPALRRSIAVAALGAAAIALVALTPLLLVLVEFRREIETAAARSSTEVAAYSLEPNAYLRRDSGTYLGLAALILAFVGLFVSSAPGVARLAAGLAALSGFGLSLRGDLTLAGIELPVPSDLVHSVAPYWRVYGRVAIVVSLAAAILASFTIDRLSRRSRVGFALAVGLAVIATADVLRRPPPPAGNLGRVDSVAVALSSGTGNVAEYPLFGFDNHMLGSYLFRQLRHGRPLLNGAVAGTISADLASAAGDLRGAQAHAALLLGGVTEVVTNPGASRPASRQFSLVKRLGNRAVYVVRDRPSDVAIAAVRGAYPPERGPDGTTFVWLGRQPELVGIASSAGPLEITFNAVSHTLSRRVQVGSRRLVVTPAPSTFRLCVSAGVSGTVILPIASQPAAAQLPGGDERVASIGVYRLEARPRCGTGSR
jgi:hypothetical protein